MKDDAAFVADLARSRDRVQAFAQLARQKSGLSIWLPPDSLRPAAAERFKYSDTGDMRVFARVEHKVRNFNFSSRETFPFQTVIVDEAYKEDAKADDPALAFIVESADGLYAAVVYGWTRDRWTKETQYDKAQGRSCVFYVVDKSLARFCRPEHAFTTPPPAEDDPA